MRNGVATVVWLIGCYSRFGSKTRTCTARSVRKAGPRLAAVPRSLRLALSPGQPIRYRSPGFARCRPTARKRRPVTFCGSEKVPAVIVFVRYILVPETG